MKFSIFDTETLGQNARQPDRMVVEQCSVLTLEAESLLEILRKYPFKEILEVGSAGYYEPVLASSGLKYKLTRVRFSLLEQIAAGRQIDQSTIQWRGKISGYTPAETSKVFVDLEAAGPRTDTKTALDMVMASLKGSDVVFCRGTDFDITVTGNLAQQFGSKESYRYNTPRDIRTACDELVGDFNYSNLVTPERLAALMTTPYSRVEQYVLDSVKRIGELRKIAGHDSTVDVMLDTTLYFLLKAWRQDYVAFTEYVDVLQGRETVAE